MLIILYHPILFIPEPAIELFDHHQKKKAWRSLREAFKLKNNSTTPRHNNAEGLLHLNMDPHFFAVQYSQIQEFVCFFVWNSKTV